MNALDRAMFAGARRGRRAAEGRPSVRAVVLSGEGRAFCAGLDFGELPGHGRGDGARRSGRAVQRLDARRSASPTSASRRRRSWQEMPVPVIAAVHGVALGGGIQIALGADIRIVAPDAKLSVLEIRWGLIPDMTGTVLPRLVGLDVAKELTFTGRMVSGTEAGRSASPPAWPTTRSPTPWPSPARSPARTPRRPRRQAPAQPGRARGRSPSSSATSAADRLADRHRPTRSRRSRPTSRSGRRTSRTRPDRA